MTARQLPLFPTRSKLAQYQITPANFQTQLIVYNEGLPVGQVQEGEQMLTILLRNTNFKNNSVDLIKNQPIFAPDGSYKPLEVLCRC